jgi:hypothetical protein
MLLLLQPFGSDEDAVNNEANYRERIIACHNLLVWPTSTTVNTMRYPVENASRNASSKIDERPTLAVLQETHMAETEKEAYLALIAECDTEIRALLDQGFEFVTNAFKADAAPWGMKARTDREHVRRLQQAGYQVEVTAAYDEQGHPRPTLSAIWRKKL